jgi:hypothetical protein
MHLESASQGFGKQRQLSSLSTSLVGIPLQPESTIVSKVLLEDKNLTLMKVVLIWYTHR